MMPIQAALAAICAHATADAGITPFWTAISSAGSSPLKTYEYCVWDTELPGFALRISPKGRYYWIVRLRHHGKQRRVSLGRTYDVDATLARAQARCLLVEVALDGLPKRPVVKATPTMPDYVATYLPAMPPHAPKPCR
jgi:hypothetical protein